MTKIRHKLTAVPLLHVLTTLWFGLMFILALIYYMHSVFGDKNPDFLWGLLVIINCWAFLDFLHKSRVKYRQIKALINELTQPQEEA